LGLAGEALLEKETDLRDDAELSLAGLVAGICITIGEAIMPGGGTYIITG